MTAKARATTTAAAAKTEEKETPEKNPLAPDEAHSDATVDEADRIAGEAASTTLEDLAKVESLTYQVAQFDTSSPQPVPIFEALANPEALGQVGAKTEEETEEEAGGTKA